MDLDLKKLAVCPRARELSDILTGRTPGRGAHWRTSFAASGKPKPGKKTD